MADRIIASGDAHPIPSVGGPTIAPLAAFDQRIAIEGALINLKGLNDLAGWINRARDFIEGIEAARRRDPGFAERLRSCEFASNVVDWDEDAAEGMICLHSALHGCVDTINKALGFGAKQ